LPGIELSAWAANIIKIDSKFVQILKREPKGDLMVVPWLENMTEKMLERDGFRGGPDATKLVMAVITGA